MYKFGLIILGLVLMAPSFKVNAVNIAIFHKVDKSMVYKDTVEGSHGDFLDNMESHGAEILAMTNIPHTMSGDVITLQTSALHDDDGALGDFGLDCHLSYKDEKDGEDVGHLIGGLCKVIREGRGENIRNNVIMQHVYIPDATQGHAAWVKIGEDKETGVAFYATMR